MGYCSRKKVIGKVSCGECSGDGRVNRRKSTCEGCGGTGVAQGMFREKMCGECLGSGDYDVSDECTRCDGKGEIKAAVDEETSCCYEASAVKTFGNRCSCNCHNDASEYREIIRRSG